MAVKRLGKGLDALIPQMSTQDTEQGKTPEKIREVEVASVKPNPFQPRETFDPIALNELKQSIAENGMIQPVTVRIAGDGYELIAGERRLRAVSELGHRYVPAYVLEIESDQQMIEMALIENIQRENLNPIDEANGYQTLLTECNLTQEEVAKRVGKDRSTVTNFLRLLKLPDKVQESLTNEEISQGHARALLAFENASEQITVWKQILKKKLSVRQVESLTKKDKTVPAKSQPKTMKQQSPYIRQTEDKFRNILGTQVRILESKEGNDGKIEIEYYSSDDLDRIIELLENI